MRLSRTLCVTFMCQLREGLDCQHGRLPTCRTPYSFRVPSALQCPVGKTVVTQAPKRVGGLASSRHQRQTVDFCQHLFACAPRVVISCLGKVARLSG